MFTGRNYYKRNPESGWKNDYCALREKNDPPAGHYIEYKFDSIKMQLYHYHYPIPNVIDLYIMGKDLQSFLDVLGDKAKTIGNDFICIDNVSDHLDLIEKLVKERLLNNSIYEDIKTNIPLVPKDEKPPQP